MTQYIVFTLRDTSWHEHDRYEAASPEAAIRAMVAKAGAPQTGRTVVAVPARSWKPVDVATETKTVLRFSNHTEPGDIA